MNGSLQAVHPEKIHHDSVMRELTVCTRSASSAAVAPKPKQEPRTLSLGLCVLLEMGQACGGAGSAVHGSAVPAAESVS